MSSFSTFLKVFHISLIDKIVHIYSALFYQFLFALEYKKMTISKVTLYTPIDFKIKCRIDDLQKYPLNLSFIIVG